MNNTREIYKEIARLSMCSNVCSDKEHVINNLIAFNHLLPYAGIINIEESTLDRIVIDIQQPALKIFIVPSLIQDVCVLIENEDTENYQEIEQAFEELI